MKSFRPSLTLSILAVLTSILLLNWLLLGTISFSLSKKDLYAMKAEEGKALLATIVRALPRPLAIGSIIESGFSDFAVSLPDNDHFSGLLLIDEDGSVVYALADKRGADQRLVETVRSGAESHALSAGAGELYAYAPVSDNGKLIGAARLTLSLAKEHKRLAASQRILIAYFVIDFLLLLGLGFIFLRRSVVAPIRRLLSAIYRVSEGDYGQLVHVPGSAEIGELSESFNQMLVKLRNNRAEVRRHVSSLEEANRQLKEAREETVRSERLASIGLLAAGTAHEIGTPLAAIIGYSSILCDELSSDPEKRDYALRLQQEAVRIDRIVRDLLNYARPPRCELRRSAIPPLLEETVALLNGQGAFKDVSVTVTAEDRLPEPYIDDHQFQQVLINLLINARDAIPSRGTIEIVAVRCAFEVDRDLLAFTGQRGGRRRGDLGQLFHASVASGKTAEAVRVDIRDSGIGIPPEQLERIFDPFFTTKDPGKGTGLGLSIAARIIDSFGGKISVTSDPGLGSCFSVFLPISRQEGVNCDETL